MALTHRAGALLVAAALAALFGPLLVRGWVVFPHDNGRELGLANTESPERVHNRFFSDQSSIYVPELHHQLKGDAAGWISTWNPYPELGRPTWHVSSFSKAYLLTHVFSKLSTDAFRVYTWLAISAVCLTALFGYLLLRALDLHPAACLTGSLGLALGTFVTYWLTFVMFVWGVCWTLALLWLLTIFWQRPTHSRGLGIAFALHSLLLSGYPQQIVWHAYLLAGYAVLLMVRSGNDRRANLRCATAVAGWVLLGLLSVVPVYRDLALNAARSSRLEADPAFYLAVLPALEGWRDHLTYLGLLYDASWFGSLIRPDFPLRWSGSWFSLTPVFFSLAALSLLFVRRLWPAHLFLAVCTLMTVAPGIYELGVRHAALDISRFVPLAAAYIPVMVSAAYAADRLIQETSFPRLPGAALIALPLSVALWNAWDQPLALRSGQLVLGCLLAAGVLTLVWWRRSVLLVGLVVASCLLHASSLLLVRPIEEIRTDSPFVQTIRNEIGDRARFAWVTPRYPGLVPPNQGVLLGLKSIHTYDSLSSRIYQEWTRRVSVRGAHTYGRHFNSITSTARLAVPEMETAGIGLLVSDQPIDRGLFTPLGEGQLAMFHRPVQPPVLEAQLTRYELGEGTARIQGRLHEAGALELRHARKQDDALRFELDPSEAETLLFVSQQHHPDWRASSRGARLETVLVDDFYLGVVLPAGTESVQLDFLPWVRWSWLPQVLFAAGGLGLGVVALRGAATRGAVS